VALLDELKDGKIKSINAFGQSLVVFQGKNGTVGVLDAHCPHQGAHLGVLGKVIDNCIQCPFHNWEIGCDGVVAHIPYFEGKNLPVIKTRSWLVQIINNDLIFVWHHVDQKPPTYQLLQKPEWSNGKMYYWGCTPSQFDMHVLEMAENSPDYFHFSTLHRELPGLGLWGLFNLRFSEFQFYLDEKEPHIHYFDNSGKIYVLDKFPLPFVPPQKSHLVFEGPGVVCFNLYSIFGLVQLYKTILPVGHFNTYCEDRIYAARSVPRWFCKLYAMFASAALEQDRPVWENKIFRQKPQLVKGDGPWPAHRKWWNQFYSENSVKFNTTKGGCDW